LQGFFSLFIQVSYNLKKIIRKMIQFNLVHNLARFFKIDIFSFKHRLKKQCQQNESIIKQFS
jgi:phosphoribosyl-dephospho-CoA transferase